MNRRLLVVALLVGVAAGIGWWLSRERTPWRSPDWLALVEGVPVTHPAVVERIHCSFPNAPNFEGKLKELLEIAAGLLVEEQLLLNEARRRGLAADREEELLLRDVLFTAKAREGKTEHPSTRADLQRALLLVAVRDQLGREVPPPSGEEVAQFYQEHPDLFRKDGTVTVRRLTVSDKGQAEQLRRELLAGAGFETLVQQHSITAEKTQDGLLPPIPLETLPNLEFGNAVAGLALLELSSVVPGTAGFQILRVEERTEPSIRPLKKVRHEIIARLQEERGRRAVRNWLRRKWHSEAVQWNPQWFPQSDPPFPHDPDPGRDRLGAPRESPTGRPDRRQGER
jgi:parvulin-like peptidyl-prolyl isomerase